ncbi:protein of unknown function [Chitinophaga sp. CF118]|uniref:DUF4382 domain-containing protein n=1 Tax=Chitinophaga sp. CF118 TaxID=1884367 RepID=UPI0008F1D7E9|nr:DUF4382 domain-containing protein [Chitinophaga sp. CF118]SFD88130.1 protein of unknown function [Chitinophaga sp. CF118]
MKKPLLAVLFMAMLFIAACSKDNDNSGKSRLSVYLTDDPSTYDAVLIDIQDIQVNTTTDTASGWQSINLLRPGVYDLLKFRNGLDTVLASAEIPAGKISQIRLILGSNNSVVINGASYPLETPSSQQSGLKLNVHAQLEAGIEYKLWIDFDAKRSIVVTGGGTYILKPVIRTYAQATSGSVKGITLPATGVNWIYAIQNTDTIASAKPDLITGGFLISGLSSGSYTISIDAAAPLNDTTVNGVNVTVGQVSDLGTVQLH